MLTNPRFVYNITCVAPMLEAASQAYGLAMNYFKTNIMIIDCLQKNRPEVAEIAGVEVVLTLST